MFGYFWDNELCGIPTQLLHGRMAEFLLCSGVNEMGLEMNGKIY
jgi:hypothetical protein